MQHHLRLTAALYSIIADHVDAHGIIPHIQDQISWKHGTTRFTASLVRGMFFFRAEPKGSASDTLHTIHESVVRAWLASTLPTGSEEYPPETQVVFTRFHDPKGYYIKVPREHFTLEGMSSFDLPHSKRRGDYAYISHHDIDTWHRAYIEHRHRRLNGENFEDRVSARSSRIHTYKPYTDTGV